MDYEKSVPATEGGTSARTDIEPVEISVRTEYYSQLRVQKTSTLNEEHDHILLPYF